MALTTVPVELASLDGAVTVNESSADADFRVESNGNANMLFVDGGNDRIGIGTNSPTRQLTVENTLANSGGVIGLTSSDSSTSGTLGIIHYGNSTDSSLASINGIADGATDAGALLFKTEATGGSIEERMRIDSSGNVNIPNDSGKIRLGTSADMLIYHDGNHSYIEDNGTGAIKIKGDDVRFENTSSNNVLKVVGNGYVTMPLQPAFQVKKDAYQSNIGTSLETVTWETEVADQGSNFASNTFTAPVDGMYQFNVTLRLQDLDTAHTYFQALLTVTNDNFEIGIIDPNFSDDLDFYHMNGSFLVKLDANDTAIVRVRHSGGTSQTDISYSGDSTFSGYLVA